MARQRLRRFLWWMLFVAIVIGVGVVARCAVWRHLMEAGG